MESANLHHHLHQLQDQLVASSSLSAPIPSTYAAGSAHAWTQNSPLDAVNLSPHGEEAILNHRQKAEDLNPHLGRSVIQDVGSYWNSNVRNFISQSAHVQQLPKIKEELPNSFARFSEMLNNPSCIEDSYLSSSNYIRNELKDQSNLSTKLKLNTIPSDFPITGNQFLPGEIYDGANSCSTYGAAIPTRGSFSQIYPSINISNLNNQSSSSLSNTLDMNFQAFDLLASSRFSGSFAQTSLPNFGLGHMQQSNNRPSSSPSEISACPNEFTETKRANSLMEPKATQAAASKKSRLDSRSSYPPFKVRKEKLGDRIAALQQLVAPFGKTDTASVLMEAIGYIKFLQNQVETLSVPYMKASSNKSNRTVQQFQGSTAEEGNEETKRDLRSRGLCLVPLSCMSYVTSSDGAGGIWPPPNFGGGT